MYLLILDPMLHLYYFSVNHFWGLYYPNSLYIHILVTEKLLYRIMNKVRH